MGVSLIHLKDGRVQLVQHATQVRKEMLSCAHWKILPANSWDMERVVAILNVTRLDFNLISPRAQVRGFVTVAEPYSGCSEITNDEYVRGHIALLQRGQCMFAEKARHIQKAAFAVAFYNEGPSHETSST
uniref:PA domain-containing protein n=1 Tax=Hippocampus comes TaxID=109280 RepID=A0A3Q3DEK2_HIPCM